VFEELAGACPSTAAYLSIHNMATWMVTAFARPEIAAVWGPPLTRGDKLASYCLTEPNAGSDAASLSTGRAPRRRPLRAQRRKAFISGAGATDALVVMARTGGEGAGGISAFLVPEKDAPGVRYGRKEDKMGWNSQPTRAIAFDDVRVRPPTCWARRARASHRDEGPGRRPAQHRHLLGRRRQALDGGPAPHERAAPVRPRLPSSRRCSSSWPTWPPSWRPRARWCAWRPPSPRRRRPDAHVYCAMAKRFATDAGFQVCNEALQIHGGYGYIREYPLERWLRDVRVHQILEGTNEIMRVIVGRRMLQDDSTENIR
jgi:alkylation response protein AidB-like acyl-CoA dehydrogenase